MNGTPEEMTSRRWQEIRAISPSELLTMRKTNAPYTLIDVRERTEWNAGHIDDAIHIPGGLLEFKIQDVVVNKNTPIIVHCTSGGRSALCAQILQKMGYTNVKNLEGGYMAYQEALKARTT